MKDEKNFDPEAGKRDFFRIVNSGSKDRVEVEKRKKKIMVSALAVFFGILFLALIVGVALGTVFKIKEITLEGCSHYSEDEILSALEINYGDSMFFANEKKFAKLLSAKYPMVYSIKLEKEYPSKLRIKITEEEASYRYMDSGMNVVVSHRGKVIYLGSELPEEFEHILVAKVPRVHKAVLGRAIEYIDPLDKTAVEEVVKRLQDSGFYEYVNDLEMSSRFDIKFNYSHRFKVLLGDRTDIEVKLKFVEGIIKTLQDGETGTINVKNAKKGYLILDE